MTNMVYIRYHDNWADEFDIDAGLLMTVDEYKELVELIKLTFKILDEKNTFNKAIFEEEHKNERWAFFYEETIEYYFGTNEGMNYSNVDDILKNIEVKELSATESGFLKRMNLGSFGMNDPITLYFWIETLDSMINEWDEIEFTYIIKKPEYMSIETYKEVKTILKKYE